MFWRKQILLIKLNGAIQIGTLILMREEAAPSSKMQMYADKERGGVISMQTFALKCF